MRGEDVLFYTPQTFAIRSIGAWYSTPCCCDPEYIYPTPRYLPSWVGEGCRKQLGAKSYGREMRKELEEYWKPKLQQQHAKHAQRKKDIQKYYVLSMFPYPSGKLHMGHVRVYTISDAMARYHRLTGKYVIHPMGWDAFGLPAENAAIERGELPDEWTYSNIATMKHQLQDLSFSFDWDREYATCDPAYYRWTQYIFLKMFEAGLVYQKKAAVNWDPVDQTVLADEQIDENGHSWRSGALVEKKFLKQWYIKTTAYSKSLYDGLKDVNPELWQDIIDLQQHWIGKCEGARFEFRLQDASGSEVSEPLSVFTLYPEALHGASHITLSTEHPLNDSVYYKNIAEDGIPDKELSLVALHPLTGKSLPIYVQPERDFGEHLDSHIGIPCTSEEDLKFARSHGLTFETVLDKDGQTVINSGQFSGMSRTEAFEAVVDYAKEFKFGGNVTSERARDWLISRQRYWGTPIPVVHCPKYGAMPVPYEDLPVTLPKVTEFTGKGASPLTRANDWLQVKCPRCDCDGYATRETDTMDTFVDSSWYFLRYLDPSNELEPVSKELAHKYIPVDLYIGGKEHAIMHMYYARFFSHFLYDCGVVPQREPFTDLLTQGMVMGQSYALRTTGQYLRPDQVDFTGKEPVEKGTGAAIITAWEKMSKSKHNGVDPQDILDEHGCDATRLCILSNVSPQSDRHWNAEAFVGVWRWKARMWGLIYSFLQQKNEKTSLPPDQETLQKYEEEIFNERNYFVNQVTFHMTSTFMLSVAISRLQGFTSALKRVPQEVAGHSQQYERALNDLVIMLSPFAPLISSEMWTGLASVSNDPCTEQRDNTVHDQQWPVVDAEYRRTMKVKINSRDVFEVRLPMPISETHSLTKDQALFLAQHHPSYQQSLEGVQVTETMLVTDPVRCELIYTAPGKRKSGSRAKSIARKRKAASIS